MISIEQQAARSAADSKPEPANRIGWLVAAAALALASILGISAPSDSVAADLNPWFAPTDLDPDGLKPLKIANAPENIATADFAARCSSPGVFYCQGFDEPIPTSSKKPEGVFLNGCPSCDPAVRKLPHVENGALKFEIVSNSNGSASGNFYAEFANAKFLGREIGPGESVYYQWRQYFPKALLETAFMGSDGRQTTFKLSILSDSGTSSCTANEMVVVNGRKSDRLVMYHACGYSFNFPVNHYELTPDRWGTFQVGLEPAGAPYTETVKDKVRTRYPYRIQLWQQFDDEGPVEVQIDTIFDLYAISLGWGRLWATPYMTNKDPAQVHPDTFTEIDEVIVSTRRIPDRPIN